MTGTNLDVITLAQAGYLAGHPPSRFGSRIPSADDALMQEAFPLESLPQRIQDVVEALGFHTQGVSPLPMRVGVTMGSIAAVAAATYDVQWPTDGSSTALSLYIISMAESGARKSAAYGPVFSPHEEGDERIENRRGKAWKALREWTERQAARAAVAEPPSDSEEGRAPRTPSEAVNYMLYGDTTYEATLQGLKGRKNITLASDESQQFLGNWSNQDANRGRTMSGLAGLWDRGYISVTRASGQRFRVRDARMTMVLLVQKEYGLGYLLAPEADKGFSARALVSLDDRDLPVARPGRADEGWAAEVFEEFADDILWARKYIDDGAEFDDYRSLKRYMMTLSDESRKFVDDFEDEAREEARRCRGRDLPNARSYWVRAAEHAVRFAANFNFSENVLGTNPSSWDDIVIADSFVEAGMRIARWHGTELARIEEIGGKSALEAICEEAMKIMPEPPERFRSRSVKGGVLLKSWMMTSGPRRWRSDKRLHDDACNALDGQGRIRHIEKGVYKLVTEPQVEEVQID